MDNSLPDKSVGQCSEARETAWAPSDRRLRLPSVLRRPGVRFGPGINTRSLGLTRGQERDRHAVNRSQHDLVKLEAAVGAPLFKLDWCPITGSDGSRTIDLGDSHDHRVQTLTLLIEKGSEVRRLCIGCVSGRDNFDAGVPVNQHAHTEVLQGNLVELKAQLAPEPGCPLLVLRANAKYDMVETHGRLGGRHSSPSFRSGTEAPGESTQGQRGAGVRSVGDLGRVCEPGSVRLQHQSRSVMALSPDS